MEHKDYFGQPLAEGDYCVASYTADPKSLAAFKVVKNTGKMILIKRLGTTRGKGSYRYSTDVVWIDPKLITLKGLSK